MHNDVHKDDKAITANTFALELQDASLNPSLELCRNLCGAPRDGNQHYILLGWFWVLDTQSWLSLSLGQVVLQ